VAERATIARPYAKAAFETARQANAFAAWSAGLAVAAEIVSDARVKDITDSPRWTASDLRGFVVGIAGAKLDQRMQNFIGILAENHRLLLLPEILVQFEALRASVENTIEVDVVSAVALNEAQTTKLTDALTRRFKRKVRMQNSVDATLLGGAVVRAGDMVIDGSLKGRLERLATELEV
jgi:F-type H+-transporting ATPase subunit delta